MTDLTKTVDRACSRLIAAGIESPAVGIILGSGLGGLADAVEDPVRVPTGSVPGLPPPTVKGHEGVVVGGTLDGVPVVLLKGRAHAYEGHAPAVLGLPARILCALGIRALVLTNAAGAVNPAFRPGDLMLIRDHVNLLGFSPLEGPNVEAWGPRFPDMSHVYPGSLRLAAEVVAETLGLQLVEGVYAACRGPQYETPAEVRMLSKLGIDAVGMSTVPEAIIAAHMGVPVLGISLISNAAAGLAGTSLSHADVLEAAERSGQDLADLVTGMLTDL